MIRTDIGEPQANDRASLFTNTHWSQVLLAADPTEQTKAAEALEYLCRSYWYPLYAYVRRCGHNVHEAQDLTQEFFARILERQDFARADPGKGRLRSFLLGAMKHFLAMEWRKTQVVKRGGQQVSFSLDAQTAEDRYQYEPVSELTPEKIYERRWALTLFDRALAHLHDEWQTAGKQEQFNILKPFLSSAAGEAKYAPAASTLGMTTGAVAVAVHRMRQRCAELIRQEIAQTVVNSAELEAELEHLFSVFGS